MAFETFYSDWRTTHKDGWSNEVRMRAYTCREVGSYYGVGAVLDRIYGFLDKMGITSQYEWRRAYLQDKIQDFILVTRTGIPKFYWDSVKESPLFQPVLSLLEERYGVTFEVFEGEVYDNYSLAGSVQAGGVVMTGDLRSYGCFYWLILFWRLMDSYPKCANLDELMGTTAYYSSYINSFKDNNEADAAAMVARTWGPYNWWEHGNPPQVYIFEFMQNVFESEEMKGLWKCK